MGVSSDASYLDIAYKLTDDATIGDVIARAGEELSGRLLLRPVMRTGRRLREGRESLTAMRNKAAEGLVRRRWASAVVD